MKHNFLGLMLSLNFFVTGLAQAKPKTTVGIEVFEKLKSLQGNWQGHGDEGDVTISYQVIASGTAVIERFMDMITVYHLNGEELYATHYCEAGNQPRLVLDPAKSTPEAAQFVFKDMTGSEDPNEGHIDSIRFKFISATEMNQSWTWKENGEEKEFGTEFKKVAAQQHRHKNR